MNRRGFLSLLAGAIAGRKLPAAPRPVNSGKSLKALLVYGRISNIEYAKAYQRALNRYLSMQAEVQKMAPEAPWVRA